jgi:hypothetical protein
MWAAAEPSPEASVEPIAATGFKRMGFAGARNQHYLQLWRPAAYSGLLNADQHFGYHRFSSQILAFQSLRQSSGLAAVGSGGPFLAASRDNSRNNNSASARPQVQCFSGSRLSEMLQSLVRSCGVPLSVKVAAVVMVNLLRRSLHQCADWMTSQKSNHALRQALRIF